MRRKRPGNARDRLYDHEADCSLMRHPLFQPQGKGYGWIKVSTRDWPQDGDEHVQHRACGDRVAK